MIKWGCADPVQIFSYATAKNTGSTWRTAGFSTGSRRKKMWRRCAAELISDSFNAHEKEIPAPAAPPRLRICRHRLAGNRASYRNMTQSTVCPVLVSFINHQMPLILIKFRSYSRQIQTVRLYFSYLRHYNITERRFCQVLSLHRPFPATYVPLRSTFCPE